MSRPEDLLPPDLFYSSTEATKYRTSSRIKHIQTEMTHRALSLLSLSSPSLILDLGCGTALSGSILSDPSTPGGPHIWMGMDISSSMLGQALDSDIEGDLLLSDIGQGVPFRPGSFDAAISISAIQWLCNAETSSETAEGRLKRFFEGLYSALKRGGRAVCQFYPRDSLQRELICKAAIKAGFGAGVLEDDPGTKNEKLYLVLTVGGSLEDGEDGKRGMDITSVVADIDGVDVQDDRRRGANSRTDRVRKSNKGDSKGTKAWILKKKEKMERQGKVVKASSKYTGRKRRIQF